MRNQGVTNERPLSGLEWAALAVAAVAVTGGGVLLVAAGLALLYLAAAALDAVHRAGARAYLAWSIGRGQRSRP